MNFNSVSEVKEFLKTLKRIGGKTVQGDSYYDLKKEKVYKLYKGWKNQKCKFYSSEKILEFKSIKNSTFIFPQDVITLNEQVIGEIDKYVEAINLNLLNPFTINLDYFIKVIRIALEDINLISENGIIAYDMMYNIMLGERLYIVDTLEYVRRNLNPKVILSKNTCAFNIEIMRFLIDGYFENAISQNKILNDMYNSHGLDMNIIEFTTTLKSYFSELIGYELEDLGMASGLAKSYKMNKYIRK